MQKKLTSGALPQNYFTVLAHLSLWAAFLGIPFILDIFWQEPESSLPISLPPVEIRRTVGIVLNIALVGLFYLNYSLLLPKLYLRGRLRFYLLSILVAYSAFQVLGYLLRNLVVLHVSGAEAMPGFVRVSTAISSGFFLLMWAASSGFRLGEEWRRAEANRRETERRRLEAELALLKSQINPHFLLNSLNNLYGLALTSPERTPDAILKLSEMVAYILYECDKPQVPLSSDLRFIENFIALQRLRLPPNAELKVDLPAAAPSNYTIEPMILISFIENAFKHGLTTKQPCLIEIGIKTDQQKLVLVVENEHLPAKTTLNGNVPGIGLANTRQRLEHAYSGRHHLLIADNGQKHRVELELQLQQEIRQ